MVVATAPRMVHTVAQTPQREPTLQEIHESLDLPGHRVEILGGRIIVSPSPLVTHGRIVVWLIEALSQACVANKWDRLPQTTVDLVATDERIVPDLLVYPGDQADDDRWMVPADGAVLVVEIVSPSSTGDDYGRKRESCAKNGIPMYLIVDPYDATLTLCSEPAADGYRLVHAVDVGDKLGLPEPFGLTLDTAAMPIKRAAT